jgi:NTE family protein
MLNAIFLDALEADATNLQRLNHLLELVPPQKREGLRPVRLLTTRPSESLGRLAAHYEARLPQPFRFLERGLGTQETRSPDSLSMLMFQPEYIGRLIELGARDAERRGDEILAFASGRSAVQKGSRFGKLAER